MHIKAHTDGADEVSKLNNRADTAAKAAHLDPDPGSTTVIPAPTAYMRKYTPHHHGVGYLTYTWSGRLDQSVTRWQQGRMPLPLRLRPDPMLGHHPVPTPEHYYQKSPGKHVAKVQYSARVGFIQSYHRDYRQGVASDPSCRLCGILVGDADHIFYDCPWFDDDRTVPAEQTRRPRHQRREPTSDVP